MITAEVFTYEGVELPVWFFETWKEFEQFNEMLGEDWLAHVREDLFGQISGFVYKDWPMSVEHRVAAFAVVEDWYEDAARRDMEHDHG